MIDHTLKFILKDQKFKTFFFLLILTTFFSCVKFSVANQLQQFQKDSIPGILYEKFRRMNYTGPGACPLGIELSMKRVC